MPGTRRYPPERIRYATYIWPADWQPAETTSTSASTSITSSDHYNLQQQQQQQQICACCIPSSYYYVPPSPEAFQRHRFVLSRCEQLDPSLLHRHGYSQLISDATSVVLWAIWTHLVYDAELVYMSVDYFCWLKKKTVPTEPFPFTSHPPTKTGPPYSDVVQYFLCRADGLQCLEGIFATSMNEFMNCSNRYHTRWKMQHAIQNIFNGGQVSYGGNCVCGLGLPLVASCACLEVPWPVMTCRTRDMEPVVMVRVEERTKWKKKKKVKESGCLVM
ncbi:hypothetical protein NEUTE1DRAFT_46311 [Neurospora tetrasperma FGSC 2508]|uniref:Uncharacterized protein n=1 Tax=Neurospora tetrasperma (strain FGSC 2508 / ATCC MYA-4615 / P0657) TaxID=510951 RepID=F8MSQ3_NEUT8|nr:uncharacterized protein NEUTE1DRAFT_46311 [Neurospora tetrasperma FGSC 2508]EGO55939.1 hypothetical protein NEUTE1DRAFT_46311 [Neurospora tetrasperma FGSC 2508]